MYENADISTSMKKLFNWTTHFIPFYGHTVIIFVLCLNKLINFSIIIKLLFCELKFYIKNTYYNEKK